MFICILTKKKMRKSSWLMLTLTFKTTLTNRTSPSLLLNQAALSSFDSSRCTAGNGDKTFHNANSTHAAWNPASRTAPCQAADLCSTIHVSDMFPVALRSLTWQRHGAVGLSQALRLKKKKQKKRKTLMRSSLVRLVLSWVHIKPWLDATRRSSLNTSPSSGVDCSFKASEANGGWFHFTLKYAWIFKVQQQRRGWGNLMVCLTRARLLS